MIGDGVEGVRSQLVVPDEDEEQVELDAALDVDDLVLPLAHLLALQDRLLDHRLHLVHPPEEREVPHV